MKHFAFSLPFILVSCSLFAQYDINGRIIDERSTGVPFANVLVLNSSDSTLVKGSITDQNGNYLIADVSSGNFFIQSSMVGFQKSYSESISLANGSEIKIKDIILRESSTELEAVVVEAEKPLYEQTIDRMVVNVSSSPIMAGNSVLEILEKSPGVVVDRMNNDVRMNGKNGVSVMINGKMTRMEMTTLFSMLEGMPSNNVEKIELITTPPANFDAEGNAGFINIVLKHLDYEGLNGNLAAMIGRNRKRQYSLGGGINYRKKKINLFADFSHQDIRQHQIVKHTSRIQNDDFDFISTSGADRHPGFNTSSARMGIDYYISSKSVIGVLGTIFSRNWKMNSSNHAFYELTPGVDTLLNGNTYERDETNQHMVNINLFHEFKQGSQFSIDLDYFKFYQNQPVTYSNQYYPENLQTAISQDLRVEKTTPIKILVGKTDYKTQLDDQLTLEVGVKATLNQVENEITTERLESNSWQIDPLFSEFTTMDENILATYASLSRDFSQGLSLKAGLRYEYTLTDIRNLQMEQLVFRQYGNFFPTVYVSQKLSEHSNINVAYSYRINRPTFSDLAPFVLFIDPKTFLTGNTNLLPALTHSLRSNYSIKGLNFSFEYSKILNSIGRRQPSRIPDTDITLLGALNLDNTTLFNVSFTIPITVTGWWEMNNSFGGIMSHIQSLYYKNQLDVTTSWVTINTTQNFKLSHSYGLQLSGVYFSGGQSGVAVAKPMGMVSVGLRKELKNNGGIINLSATDIFRTMIIRRGVDGSDFNFYSGYRLDFDVQSFKLTYTNTFGNKKLKSRSKRETGAAEDLQRL